MKTRQNKIKNKFKELARVTADAAPLFAAMN